MIKIRKSEDRGAVQTDWLDSKHSFSFGHYYDPAHMGFGVLRVINEDKVLPKTGFSTHPHRNMEIITYILEGALEHKDSLGNGSIIVPGDVQRMSAGTGIMHSEFNPLDDKTCHLLQIWILPEKDGGAPSYEQKNFSAARSANKLTLLASKTGRDGSVSMGQDAELSVLDLEAGNSFNYQLPDGRMSWLQMARGSVNIGEHNLKQGDGAAINIKQPITIQATEKAEILIFDLPQ